MANKVRPVRMPLISGNWKMHHSHLDAIAVARKLAFTLPRDIYDSVEVSLHPAFTALRSVQILLDSDQIPIALGAQDTHFAEKGAYTGEISPLMLAKLDVRYVIVGHSERREHSGETDELVNRKLRAVLEHGMIPIVCVGESEQVRAEGGQDAFCAGQLRAALAGLKAETAATVVVAYEPIWAIGTGQNATAADAQAMCSSLRAVVADVAGDDAANRVRIQYGGSVKAGTIAELMAQPDVDGALVGGASLDAEEFAKVVCYQGS